MTAEYPEKYEPSLNAVAKQARSTALAVNALQQAVTSEATQTDMHIAVLQEWIKALQSRVDRLEACILEQKLTDNTNSASGAAGSSGSKPSFK